MKFMRVRAYNQMWRIAVGGSRRLAITMVPGKGLSTLLSSVDIDTTNNRTDHNSISDKVMHRILLRIKVTAGFN
jgi:hypothetical protein